MVYFNGVPSEENLTILLSYDISDENNPSNLLTLVHEAVEAWHRIKGASIEQSHDKAMLAQLAAMSDLRELKRIVVRLADRRVRLVERSASEMSRDPVEIDLCKASDSRDVEAKADLLGAILHNRHHGAELKEYVDDIAQGRKASYSFRIALRVVKAMDKVQQIDRDLIGRRVVEVVFATYNNCRFRMMRQDEHVEGQDSLREKIRQLERLFGGTKHFEWRLRVVDDQSKNDAGGYAWEIMQKEFPELVAAGRLSMERVQKKEGPKGGAIIQGMGTAVKNSADIVLFTDSDNSAMLYFAGDIVWDIIKEGFDASVGSRFAEGAVVANRGLLRLIQNWQDTVLFNWLVTRHYFPEIKNIQDTQNGFKGFTRAILQEILPRTILRGAVFDVELLYLAHTFRQRGGVREFGMPWIDNPQASNFGIKAGLKMRQELINAALKIHSQKPVAPSARSRPGKRMPEKFRVDQTLWQMGEQKIRIPEVGKAAVERAVLELRRQDKDDVADLLERRFAAHQILAPPVQDLADDIPNVFQDVFGLVYFQGRKCCEEALTIYISQDISDENHPENLRTLVHEAVEAWHRLQNERITRAHQKAELAEKKVVEGITLAGVLSACSRGLRKLLCLHVVPKVLAPVASAVACPVPCVESQAEPAALRLSVMDAMEGRYALVILTDKNRAQAEKALEELTLRQGFETIFTEDVDISRETVEQIYAKDLKGPFEPNQEAYIAVGEATLIVLRGPPGVEACSQLRGLNGPASQANTIRDILILLAERMVPIDRLGFMVLNRSCVRLAKSLPTLPVKGSVTAAVGDLHGNYPRLIRLLNLLRKLEKDIRIKKIVFLGDYMDRGLHGVAVVRLLMKLQRLRRALGLETEFLMGNHELMFLQGVLGNNTALTDWIFNGGVRVCEEVGLSAGDSLIQRVNFWVSQEKSAKEIADLYSETFDDEEMGPELTAIREELKVKLADVIGWMAEELQLSGFDKKLLYVHAGFAGPVSIKLRRHAGQKGLRVLGMRMGYTLR
ncbi:MAG: metallophosphoesterase, partial [Candidatus Omnitrophica bacterium]|nr:metallophosphoesterase [Candidatus Omnitrophota bacterium]